MSDDEILANCKLKLYEVLGGLQRLSFNDSDIDKAMHYISDAVSLIDRTDDE